MTQDIKMQFVVEGFLADDPDAISFSSVANIPGADNISFRKHKEFFEGVKQITGYDIRDKETIKNVDVLFEIPQITLDQVNQINQLAKRVGFKIKWPNLIELSGKPKPLNNNKLENNL